MRRKGFLFSLASQLFDFLIQQQNLRLRDRGGGAVAVKDGDAYDTFSAGHSYFCAVSVLQDMKQGHHFSDREINKRKLITGLI